MTPDDISAKYRKRFLKNQALFNKKYKALFDRVAQDIAELSNNPNIRFTKAFNFNKTIQNEINAIITRFNDSALQLTEDEIRKSWTFSNEKNDEIVSQYLKAITGLKTAGKAKYYLYNTRALKAFITREKNAQTLSGAIWKVSAQLRAEMEIHLGMGIANGDSAQVISQRIRKYLNNPDALFRRVRDNNGKLVASQKMIEFRKANGLTQGTYTSAYKNALRVARTETNMAYLLADHIRWNQLDMVKGVKISLSAQHPDYNFEEICEVLDGIYPKWFVFVGWHPACLCHATPVLSSEEDFIAYLRGGKKELNKMVTQYPTAFREYVRDNYERLSNYSSVPYWIQDNQDIIKQFVNN